jgi:hypothetical protein
MAQCYQWLGDKSAFPGAKLVFATAVKTGVYLGLSLV